MVRLVRLRSFFCGDRGALRQEGSEYSPQITLTFPSTPNFLPVEVWTFSHHCCLNPSIKVLPFETAPHGNAARLLSRFRQALNFAASLPLRWTGTVRISGLWQLEFGFV